MFLILTGLILTFFVILFIITSIIHKKQFAYNTHQDYNYPSLPSTAHATLKGGSLTLPATISGQDTVIAKIRIKSTWTGLLVLPFVETISSKGKWKQYFEYGAKGVRQNPEKEIKSTKIDTTDVDIFRRANTSPLANTSSPVRLGTAW